MKTSRVTLYNRNILTHPIVTRIFPTLYGLNAENKSGRARTGFDHVLVCTERYSKNQPHNLFFIHDQQYIILNNVNYIHLRFHGHSNTRIPGCAGLQKNTKTSGFYRSTTCNLPAPWWISTRKREKNRNDRECWVPELKVMWSVRAPLNV